jgi:hypothetical protein
MSWKEGNDDDEMIFGYRDCWIEGGEIDVYIDSMGFGVLGEASITCPYERKRVYN